LNNPCGFLLHPSFFLIFNSLVGPVDPANFAVRIIQHCCAGRGEEGEAKRRKKSEDKAEHLTEIAHSLLLFLWNLDGSNGNAVTIDDPPEHESVEAEIEFRGKMLRKWTRTAKALVREEEGDKKPRAKRNGDPSSSDSSSEGEEDPERSPEPEAKVGGRTRQKKGIASRAALPANLATQGSPSPPTTRSGALC
jgi:hypothetical protein